MLQKVFITKYALTNGIEEVELDVKENPEHFKKSCYGKWKGYSLEAGREMFYNGKLQVKFFNRF